MPQIRFNLNKESALILTAVVILFYLFLDAIRKFYSYYVIYYIARDLYNIYKKFVEGDAEFVRIAPDRAVLHATR